MKMGPYTLGKEIEREVYLARTEDGQEFVMKKARVRPGIATQFDAEKFLQAEFEVQRELDHPNMCPVTEFLRYNADAYLVTPKIEGSTLQEFEGTEEENLRILSDVAQALAYCNSKGVIHLDVKPKNIIVNEGRGKLIDFGSAKLIYMKRELIDDNCLISNTHYAPETLDNNFGMTSDTFSFSVIAYELLTGDDAFERLKRGTLNPKKPKYEKGYFEMFGEFGRLIRLGLKLNMAKRPRMREVSEALEEMVSKAEVPLLQVS